jgi:TPR repeat protein
MGRNPDIEPRGGNRPRHPARLYAAILIFGAALSMHASLASAQEPAPGVAEEELPTAAIPDQPLLAPQPEPDCEFKTTDANANERQKLDYERQCYRHAEMIVRGRLKLLQDSIEPRTAVDAKPATTTATQASAPTSIDREEAERLVGAGDRHFAQGNVAIAREYYIRAAELGSAAAAMRMAETHDPSELASRNVRGVKPDLGEAKRWYQRAVELKAEEAESRLRRLSSQ